MKKLEELVIAREEREAATGNRGTLAQNSRYEQVSEAETSKTERQRQHPATRLFRLLANLLFEKGENSADVSRTLEGFVEPRIVRKWYAKYQQLNAYPDRSENPRRLRLPVPPIDWDAITIETISNIQRKAAAGDLR